MTLLSPTITSNQGRIITDHQHGDKKGSYEAFYYIGHPYKDAQGDTQKGSITIQNVNKVRRVEGERPYLVTGYPFTWTWHEGTPFSDLVCHGVGALNIEEDEDRYLRTLISDIIQAVHAKISFENVDGTTSTRKSIGD